MKRLPSKPQIHWSQLSVPLKLTDEMFADRDYLDQLQPKERRTANGWALWLRSYYEKQEAAATAKKKKPAKKGFFEYAPSPDPRKRSAAKRASAAPKKKSASKKATEVIVVKPRNKIERELHAIENPKKQTP